MSITTAPIATTFRDDKLIKLIISGGAVSPCYVYDLAVLDQRIQHLKALMPAGSRAFFAMKCNHVPEILTQLAQAGFGVDLVSGGEWLAAKACGFSNSDVIFSGVGKTVTEIDEAINHNFHQLNIESLPELERVIARAKTLGKVAQISLRLNLGIPTNTHPHISTGNLEHKFGLPLSQLDDAIAKIIEAGPAIRWHGVASHVGSQITELEPFRSVLTQLLEIAERVSASVGITLSRIDCGGGWAIDYLAESEGDVFPLKDWMHEITRAKLTYAQLQFQFEPGRWLVANAGALLARVEYVKRTPTKNFLIVNTGMHHFMRPAIYGAYHRIAHLPTGGCNFNSSDVQNSGYEKFDVVGPICESTDLLGRDRYFKNPQEGDYILIRGAGAYGEVMANSYNLQAPPGRVFLSRI